MKLRLLHNIIRSFNSVEYTEFTTRTNIISIILII